MTELISRMFHLTILFLLFKYLHGSSLVRNGDYEYYIEGTDSKYWQEAREFCMDWGGDLASIHDEEENAVISKLIVPTGAWIGLTRLKSTEWYWSDGTANDYTFWSDDNPDWPTNGLEYPCVYIKIQESLAVSYNYFCSNELGFVCKRQINATDPVIPIPEPTVAGYCPQGYYGIDNKCFKVVLANSTDIKALSWNDALLKCKEEVPFGLNPGLASIHSDNENAIITAQLNQIIDNGGVWIGLWWDATNYQQRHNRWTDNSPNDYYNFASSDHEKKGYRYISLSGQWLSDSETYHKGYVCQVFKDPDHIITQTPSPIKGCAPNYIPYWYGCYRIVKTRQTWSASKGICEAEGAVLVTIHAVAENAVIFAALSKIENDEDIEAMFWMGLSRSETSGEYTWSDGWAVLYTAWGANEPSTTENGGCVVMKNDGKWFDIKCSEEHQAVCKITDASIPAITEPPEIEGDCPPPPDSFFSLAEFGGHCYYFYVNSYGAQNWISSQESCRLLHPSSNLASIHSHTEMQFIWDTSRIFTNDWTLDDIWIGLYRSAKGDMEWIDGTAVEYTKWAPGEPNANTEGDCVASIHSEYFSGYWSVASCTTSNLFVCKMPKVPRVLNDEGSCPSEEWIAFGKSCYYLDPDEFLTRESAQDDCLQKGGSQSNLASVEDFQENQFIISEMFSRSKLPFHRPFWIGLEMNKSNGQWQWNDGKPVTYSNWNQYEPQHETYASMRMSDGYWETVNIEALYGHVCKVPIVNDRTDNDSGQSGGNGLNSGEIAGIVIGVLFIICFILVAVITILRYRYPEFIDIKGDRDIMNSEI